MFLIQAPESVELKFIDFKNRDKPIMYCLKIVVPTPTVKQLVDLGPISPPIIKCQLSLQSASAGKYYRNCSYPTSTKLNPVGPVGFTMFWEISVT